MYGSIIKSAITVFALTATVSAAPSPASPYPDKCGDMVCPSDKPKCCGVYYNGGVGLECMAGTTCPPIQYPTHTTMITTTSPTPPPATTTATPPTKFGPKCGDSFFCKPGQVCCTLYTCADSQEQCPK
ncbi:cytosolic Fe-S cluster assembling factor cfd1 [Purpureocillium lavendulum]|uniref:Cytosolic Fe-S cluster assembling factor cfd1 n=1 Tax=Purpureocillium lavendulum TaxID=1247861 RepID=A0AB34FM18_9HYPO|nr:cytosolic Fe-S cluster assembling factor cfd1 [Purpureocillium lavendulum]